MMSSDWDEIKRLAADLQRTQLLSTSQRLSERNCVEIISKLIELQLLDVVYTSSGKEYITPEQISREIRDELTIEGGRIGLPELAQVLSVDFSHVEVRAQKLAREDKSIHLVNGYLISHEYMDILAEEVNEKLQQSGEISIGELTTQYDLPAEFLERELRRRVGTFIFGEPDPEDPRTLFTEAFVARNRARVAGCLSAVTRPVTVLQLLQQHHIKEQLFFSVAAELLSSGRVKGTLTGGRQAVRAVFIPDCYTTAQNVYVEHQYRQHGCVEYDALRRVGISDPETFVRRRFRDEQLTFLSSCVVGSSLMEQIQVSVEEAMLAGSLVDVLPLLPSSFSVEDVGQLLEACSCSGSSSGYTVFSDSVVVSEKLLDSIRQPLCDDMPERARQDIGRGLYPVKQTTGRSARGDPEESKRDRKDERRKKAAGGKAGGGTQGRETKTKSTKKKYMKKNVHDSDDGEDDAPASENSGDVVFLSLDELEAKISMSLTLEDAPDELVPEIARYLFRPLTRKYQESLLVEHQSIMASEGQARRRNFNDFQDKVMSMLLNIRLFEKGAAEFVDDTRSQLFKHLLRSLCADLCGELCVYAALQNNVQLDVHKQLTVEARMRIINQLPSEDVSEPLLALHKSLTSPDLQEFNRCTDPALAVCGVHVRKLDRKKERQQYQQHVQGVLAQLNGSVDAALCLHLASLLLFHTFTGHMVHASGKFVPAIITRLRTSLPEGVLSTLQQCQALVMRQLKLSPDDPENGAVHQQLQLLLPRVKELAASTRRSTSTSE